MHVKGHPFDAKVIEGNIGLNDRNIDLFLNDLSNQNWLVMRGLERLSFENICNAAALAYPPDAQLRYLDMFIDASLAKYRMATHVGESVAINFLGNQYVLTPEDVDYTVSDQSWILGYIAALARRKMPIVHAFCDVDLGVVAQRDRTKGGLHSSLFARFLQRLFVKGEPHGQNLLAAVGEIKKDGMPEPTYEHALYIDGPAMDLFVPVFGGDEDEFNEALLNALELHGKYWRKEQANRAAGFISMPITALAVMAKDYDLSVVHTSEYVLQYLVDS